MLLSLHSQSVLALRRENLKGETPMYMKLVKGKWYANIPDPKRPGYKIQTPLDAYENETFKAVKKLGEIAADIEKGVDPTSARHKISKLRLTGKVSDRRTQALTTHIYPFFGEQKPRDIRDNDQIIEKYIVHRFGRGKDGELQAVGETLEKELQALQALLQTVYGRDYTIPKVKYTNLKREALEPLTYAQIEQVSGFVAEKYRPIFWGMVYTGMDVSDVVYLTPGDFTDGWIIKGRNKTGVEIAVPVCDPLAEILKGFPWPLDKAARIFPVEIKPKAVTTALLRAFKNAGMPGYGAKYLRRFIGAVMLDNGYSESWIAKALSHSEGSKETKKYTAVYKSTLEEAFGKIKNKAAGLTLG